MILGSRLFILLCFTHVAWGAYAAATDLSKKEIAGIESMLDSSTYYYDLDQPLEAIKWASKASTYLPHLKGEPLLKEQIHTALSRSLVTLGAHKEAITHWYGLIFHRKKHLGYYDIKCAIKYGSIGSKHLQMHEIDSAFCAFRKAQKVSTQLGFPVYSASSWNNLGMAYHTVGKSDSALICYFKAEEILVNANADQKLFATSLYENIAQHYYSRGRVHEASHFYRKAVIILGKLSDVSNTYKAKYYLNLADNLSQTKGKKGLEGVLDTAQNLIQMMPTGTRKLKAQVKLMGIQILTFPSMADSLRSEQNTMLFALNTALQEEKDRSMDGLSSYKQALLRQQKEIALLELASKEETIQGSERSFRNRVIFLSLLLMGILLSLLSVVFLNRRKTKRLLLEQKMASLEIENQRLKEEALTKELASKKSDLVDLALDNSRKLAFNKTVLSKLKEFQEQDNNDELYEVIRNLEHEFKHQNHTESRISTLQSNVDKVNKAFYQKIKDQFPNITTGELELCGYIRLQLSGKEIATLRNVNPDSITKAKQRLRKKLGMAPNTDLYSFVQSL